MNLSEYLTILYSIMGTGQSKAEFITMLIQHSTTTEPTLDEDETKIKQLSDYLVNLSDDWCGRIFSGSESFNRKISGLIISIFEGEKLEGYLSTISHDAIRTIGKKFEEKGINIENDDVIGCCARQFMEILAGIAFTPRKKSSRRTKSKQFSFLEMLNSDPYEFSKKTGLPPETLMQMDRQRKWYERFNK